MKFSLNKKFYFWLPERRGGESASDNGQIAEYATACLAGIKLARKKLKSTETFAKLQLSSSLVWRRQRSDDSLTMIFLSIRSLSQ